MAIAYAKTSRNDEFADLDYTTSSPTPTMIMISVAPSTLSNTDSFEPTTCSPTIFTAIPTMFPFKVSMPSSQIAGAAAGGTAGVGVVAGVAYVASQGTPKTIVVHDDATEATPLNREAMNDSAESQSVPSAFLEA